MSLDLSQTAMQIDSMASELKARRSDHDLRLQNALDAAKEFDSAAYESKREDSKGNIAWAVPEVTDDIGVRYTAPALPNDFCVVSVDGSHIDIDRHLPARCYLINIGVAVLRYGNQPDATLSSAPRLYARDDELVIRDRATAYREQIIEGGVLGAKRAVEEVKALAQVVEELPDDVPTLALMDGSLIMWGLTSYQDFVIRELIDEGFVKALDKLRNLAHERPLTVASYTSLPRTQEVVNALRVSVCPFESPDCESHCGTKPPGQKPCDETVGHVRDREIFAELLRPGERSCVFGNTLPFVESRYGGHGVDFFYLNVGEEIGRVEVPSWTSKDEAMLGLAHSLVLDQCNRGPGYPISLIEAHEQAVVNGADRQYFVELVENALYDKKLPVYTSEKNRTKRLRWI